MQALVVLVFIFGLLFYGELPHETTVYYMFCKGGTKKGTCPNTFETANKETFKVFPAQQTVVYWYDNDTTPPRRWKDCAIRDTQNWACPRENERDFETNFANQMVNGEFGSAAMRASDGNLFYQVSRWNWWIVRVQELIDIRSHS